MEIDSVSNETIPEVAIDLGTPEINEKRQLKNVAVKEHRLTFQKFVIVLVLSK